MHQRENVNRPINAIEEEQEIGAIGDSSDDNDEAIQEEEQLVAALKKVRLRKKKMSPKRDSSKFYTNVIKLSAYKINALSALPFAHVQIGSVQSKQPMKALVDSGSAVTLIALKLLQRLKIKYETTPFEGQIVSFTGDPVKATQKAKLYVKMGETDITYNFIIAESNVPYDLVLGIDFQCNAEMSVINTKRETYFSVHRSRIDCKSLNDPVEGLNNI